MSELTNRAIVHITDEMMAINHPFSTFIEEHLTEICTTDAVAEKLLNTEKSLKELLKIQETEMREQARKNGTGHQSAGLSDQEFYSRAEQYYGIEEEDKQEIKSHKPVAPVIDFSEFL